MLVMVSLAAASIAIIRRVEGTRILIWLAFWSGLYGLRLLILSPAVQLPQYIQYILPYFEVASSYLIFVFALFAWLELTRGKMRVFISIMISVELVIATAGITWYMRSGEAESFMLYNNLLVSIGLFILLVTVSIRKLSERLLVLPNRGVLAIGTLLFFSEALYSNLARLFGYQTKAIFGWLGFAALLFSLAYVAAKMIFSGERRLIKIESELETARQIQFSILPTQSPDLDNFGVAAAYYPMNAVAGDFYDFIRIDEHRAGFLIADVSGHGVPAALIASMIKVALQTVTDSADDPGELLGRLKKILGKQLSDGTFVTAAYLFVDSSSCQARYSAAGHPPLLYWDSQARQVRFIESNGLLFGFVNYDEYPVYTFSFNKGDRFLLYTDGLIEAENADGQLFSDDRLRDFVQSHTDMPASQLGPHLMQTLKSWQMPAVEQQDDMTWIIIDIE